MLCTVHGELQCSPSLGFHIKLSDCASALSKCFSPVIDQLSEEEISQNRQFHIHDPIEIRSMPRGATVGTCAVAIDLDGAYAQGTASWANIYHFVQALVNICVDGPGYGGSVVASGFVFVVVNPLLVDVTNTCMGPQGRRRIDVRQCVQALASSNTRIGPGGAGTSGATAIAGTSGAIAGDAIAGDAIAGDAIAGDAIAGGSIAVVGSARGTTISTSSVAFATGGTGGAGAVPVVQSRILPPAPVVAWDNTQIVYLVGSQYRIRSTWVMENNQWSPGKKKRTWYTLGHWYLMCGLGPHAPFPANPVPVWPGNAVQIVVGRVRRREIPISEGWVAKNGEWTALDGLVPQPGEWMLSGGWILLRGGSRGDSNPG